MKTAFLNGILDEEIYMEIPESMRCGNGSKIKKKIEN